MLFHLITLSLCLTEKLDDFCVSLRRGDEKWSLANVVHSVRVGSRLTERTHHTRVTLSCSAVQ